MDEIRTFLEQQQMLALFLTIAIGYLVGEINIKGFSLGAGAVLFVAIAVGWFAPKSAPAPMIGSLGLALFLYTVGIQYGKQFFVGLTSARGLKANLIALLGVLASGLVSLLFVKVANLKLEYALGLFAGSGTSTPALQAAIATLGNDDPAELRTLLDATPWGTHAEGRVVMIDDHEMISWGYSNITPWYSHREQTEEQLATTLRELAGGLKDPERAIVNVHVPPFGTQLDDAPVLDADLRVVQSMGQVKFAPVGSTA